VEARSSCKHAGQVVALHHGQMTVHIGESGSVLVPGPGEGGGPRFAFFFVGGFTEEMCIAGTQLPHGFKRDCAKRICWCTLSDASQVPVAATCACSRRTSSSRVCMGSAGSAVSIRAPPCHARCILARLLTFSCAGDRACECCICKHFTHKEQPCRGLKGVLRTQRKPMRPKCMDCHAACSPLLQRHSPLTAAIESTTAQQAMSSFSTRVRTGERALSRLGRHMASEALSMSVATGG
jgi:hypothetical protein